SVSRHLGVPVIGQIPVIDAAVEKRSIRHGLAADPLLVSLNRPGSRIAEAYRGVRTALTMGVAGHQKVIQITSANPSDGKSTLSANLAITLARSGKRCLLMDCDFRQPAVHRLFGVSTDVGVSTILEQRAEWSEAVQQGPLEPLDLMTCGPRVTNPAELLLSPQFSDLLRVVRDRYDVVIVDSPPILAVSEPSTIAAMVDGVVLVTGLSRNARTLMTRTHEALDVVGARLLGVVINAVGKASAYGTGYQRYRSYRYGDSRPEESRPAREPATDPETVSV
ncbi:MAG: CpsD/CapB family tyrosine-protein kinase, partial [Maioricimonas sp. JB049]